MIVQLSKGNQSVMRGKAVATRLRSFGSDDPNSRNERAEGHCGAVVHPKPRQEIYWRLVCRVVFRRGTLSHRAWLAAMRSEVAAREGRFHWRRTDDVHPSCVLRRTKCTTEVLFCGHYELVVCTEENSAYATFAEVPAKRLSVVSESLRAAIVVSTQTDQYRSKVALARDF